MCLSIPSQVIHIFSHIHQTYVVYSLPLDGDVTLDPALSPSRWVTEDEFHASAVSTAMKKVWRESGPFLPSLSYLEKIPGTPSSSMESMCQLQDPAAIQLWALLFFLQVLKAREKQRRQESSPVKVSSAPGCLGPQCCGTASGVPR